MLTLVDLLLLPLYLGAYVLTVRRLPPDADVGALVRTGFWVVFLTLVLATRWFGPWYLLFLMPLGAALAGTRPALVAVVFCAAAMLMYVPYFWLLHGDRLLLQAASAGTASLPPVLLALALVLAPRRRWCCPRRAG